MASFLEPLLPISAHLKSVTMRYAIEFNNHLR
jgi:hypothetical protein